jgi:DNA polymerase III epsilon subunit-like protein
MPKTYPGLVHLNGNLLAAVDVETTGRRAGYYEIIQIAVVPLGADLKASADPKLRPFYHNLRPLFPARYERAALRANGLPIMDLAVHACHPDRVRDQFVEWFERLELPADKCLVPLAHNWSFEYSHLTKWLDLDLFSTIFHAHARDAMQLALATNDRAAFAGEPAPFNRVGLESLCSKLGVNNPQPHDALCDCLAEAEVYRRLLMRDLV